MRAEATASVFAALGDETRLRVVARLSEEGPMSLARLTEGTPISRQAVTKHLRVLENAGLVRGSRAGRETIWELEAKRLAEAQRHLAVISNEWDSTIARLRRFVEQS